MCDLSIDLAAVVDDAGVGRDYFAQELERLAPFRRDGLVDVEGYRIRVSEKGRPFVRVLAAVFDVYLQEKPARHSLAV
jgi:oxygen-independent coproporphyrinogen-3 oxidase